MWLLIERNYILMTIYVNKHSTSYFNRYRTKLAVYFAIIRKKVYGLNTEYFSYFIVIFLCHNIGHI